MLLKLNVQTFTQSKFYICNECIRYLRKNKILHVSEGPVQIEKISIQEHADCPVF